METSWIETKLRLTFVIPRPNKVGKGYRNGLSPSVRHISFLELNYKSPQDIFTKFGTHIKQVVNWCLFDIF